MFIGGGESARIKYQHKVASKPRRRSNNGQQNEMMAGNCQRRV